MGDVTTVIGINNFQFQFVVIYIPRDEDWAQCNNVCRMRHNHIEQWAYGLRIAAGIYNSSPDSAKIRVWR